MQKTFQNGILKVKRFCILPVPTVKKKKLRNISMNELHSMLSSKQTLESLLTDRIYEDWPLNLTLIFPPQQGQALASGQLLIGCLVHFQLQCLFRENTGLSVTLRRRKTRSKVERVPTHCLCNIFLSDGVLF